MKYTVWRRDVLLGRTDLALPSPDPNMWSGQLETSSEFEQAWAELGPAVQELLAAMRAVANTLAEMPPAVADASPAERGRQVHDCLTTHADGLRLRAAAEGLTAMGLELRDPAGGPVPTESIMIYEVRPPAWVPSAAVERAVAEAREEGLEVLIPGYIVVVRCTADGGLPSRPPA